jgi:hypothetical protein
MVCLAGITSALIITAISSWALAKKRLMAEDLPSLFG